MNNLSKILLVIIIILSISLAISLYLYLSELNFKAEILEAHSRAVNDLYDTSVAIDNAGFHMEQDKNGELILVENNKN